MSDLAPRPIDGAKSDAIRLLIVDDSSSFCAAVEGILARAGGVEVVGVAHDGRTGLKLLAKAALAHQPIDIVLLDVQMPIKDGLSVLPDFLSVDPPPKVIMASVLTKLGAAASLRALSLGASDYLGKPSSLVDLSVDGFETALLEKVRNWGAAAREEKAQPQAGAASSPNSFIRARRARAGQPFQNAKPKRGEKALGGRQVMQRASTVEPGPAPSDKTLEPIREVEAEQRRASPEQTPPAAKSDRSSPRDAASDKPKPSAPAKDRGDATARSAVEQRPIGERSGKARPGKERPGAERTSDRRAASARKAGETTPPPRRAPAGEPTAPRPMARKRVAAAEPAQARAARQEPPSAPAETAPRRKKSARARRFEALAIGGSTGGPQALMGVLRELRGELRAPVFVTQHMPRTFTAILAEQLGKAAAIDAAEGVDGEAIQPGRLYLAPGDRHMLVRKGDGGPVIRLDDGPMENFCKPAVDPMLRSLASQYRGGLLVVILTGMGQDGMRGCQDVAEAGGHVIAQDKETSVVWGMPGAVVKMGLADDVKPLNEIAGAIRSLL